MKLIIGLVLAAVFVASVGTRHLLQEKSKTAEEQGATERARPSGGAGLVPGDTSPRRTGEAPAAEPDADVPKALPVVTEASFFGLIGFALGYLSRKLLKLALLLLALLFAAVQGLAWLGIADVNWSRAYHVFSDFVLNLKENHTLGEILKDRIPTAGSLVAGYLLGFRKG